MAFIDVALMHILWQKEQIMYGWTRSILVECAQKMQELNIKPEIEIFSPTNLEDVEDYLMLYNKARARQIPTGACLISLKIIEFVGCGSADIN